MYVPTHFSEDRIDVLWQFMRESGLATLVSMTAGGLIASHAPLLLDPDPAPYGTLIGHLAKANPHAHAADPGIQTLVDFPGAGRLHHPFLLRGKAGTREGRADLELRGGPRVRRSGGIRRSRPAAGGRYSSDRSPRNPVGRNPGPSPTRRAEFVTGMLRGIVGIALPIARLEGKVKMSQNRPAADQTGVVEGLRLDGREDLARAVARATNR